MIETRIGESWLWVSARGSQMKAIVKQDKERKGE